jgi:hypothetical protein
MFGGTRTQEETHHNRLYSEVPLSEHPERPAGEPTEATLEGEGKNVVLENRLQDRAVVAFVHSSDGDGELKVVELTQAHAYRILETVAEEEEGRREDCERKTRVSAEAEFH